MMKMIRKLSVVLLSFVMALSLAVSALAVSAERYSLLNVRFAPNGNGVNSTDENTILYTAYKLADVALNAETGNYEYTLTPAFTGAGIDINTILDGTQANADADAYRELLDAFGSYINANAEAIRAAAGDGVRAVQTGRQSIGVDNTPTDGIAQFTGLTDGLYLVTTNASVWISGTQYIPVPFLVNIPYVNGGVTNNYLTATVKFETRTPDSSDGSATPPDGPGAPTTPDAPTNPDMPAEPDTPVESLENIPPTDVPPTDSEMDIQPDDVPLAELEIEILPEDVPLADMPEDFDDLEIEIEDMGVPLAALPQTGLLWWPVPVMAAAGVVMVIGGLLVKRKAAHDA